MPFPVRHVIQRLVHSESGSDAHGNPVSVYSDPVDFPCISIGPRSPDGQAEPLMPGRDAVIIGLTILAPPPGAVVRVNGVDVITVMPSPHDRFVVGGEEYEVDGEIGDWTKGPFVFEPGISFALRRAEG